MAPNALSSGILTWRPCSAWQSNRISAMGHLLNRRFLSMSIICTISPTAWSCFSSCLLWCGPW
jgi:hypothetical protein